MKRRVIKIKKHRDKIHPFTAIFIGMVIGLTATAILKLLGGKFF